jgi:hypothetical protein
LRTLAEVERDVLDASIRWQAKRALPATTRRAMIDAEADLLRTVTELKAARATP